MKRKILLLSTILPLFCACGQTIELDEKNEGVNFKAAIQSVTKATDLGFEPGDNIGVFAVKKSASNTTGEIYAVGTNYADNAKFTYSNGYFVASSTPIYYPDDGMPLFFTAVYPYQQSMGPAFSFKVSRDQSGTGYTNSDLMTANTAATTEDTPELQFYHRLSSIIINLHYKTAPAGAVGFEFTNVDITADIDLNKRSFRAAGGSLTTVVPASIGTDSYKVILPPQTFKAGTALIKITANGSNLVWKIENDIILRSGVQLTFDLDVNNNKEITFRSVINPWNSTEDIEDIIEPEILEDMEEYIPIHRGTNPPIVNGTYFIDPFETVYCEDYGNGGYEPGHIVNSEYIKMSNQNNKNLTLDYQSVSESGNSYEEGKGSFISGNGNYFTIYFDTEGYSNDIYNRIALVISGEKKDSGIKDLYYAFVMVEKGDDPDGLLMEEGVFRVFKDKDGLSVNSSWPGITKAVDFFRSEGMNLNGVLNKLKN